MSVEKFVAIQMTEHQLLQLQPLFDHAQSQAEFGRIGIILCQPYSAMQSSPDAGKLRFGFVEHERAKIVLDVIALPPVKPKKGAQP